MPVTDAPHQPQLPSLGPAVPSHEDPLVRATSTLIGGPLGAHARLGGRRWWTVWRVLVALTVLTCTLGWAQKAQCRDTRNWAQEHSSGVYQYTRLCYSDVVALYGTEGLSAGRVPFVDHPVEYPVLIGAVMEMGRGVATLGHSAEPIGGKQGERDSHDRFTLDGRAALFFDATLLMMALATLAVVICTGLTAGRRRVWDAALVALAPTVVIHLGTNWDMLAVALASAALLLWARRRPAAAGLVLGLAVAAKAYPVLFLLPLGLLCLRAGRLRAFARTAAATVASGVGVYAAVWPFSPAFAADAGPDGSFAQLGPSAWQALTRPGGSFADAADALAPHHDGGTNGLLRFFTLNRTRGADFDSLWYAVQRVTGSDLSQGRLNLGVAGGLLLVCGGVAALALLAPRRPRLPQLLFLTAAGFLLTNKVFSPQYTLWLLPLAALARPRWRAFLAWQASEVLLLVFRFGFLINFSKNDKGVPYGWYGASVGLRDALLGLLCVLVVRDILRPGHDVVRAGGGADGGGTGDDDPAGGVLDGAKDRPAFASAPRAAPKVEDVDDQTTVVTA